MPTFEEWCSELGFHCGINSVARQAWHARDAELAAKDRMLEELTSLVSEWLCDKCNFVYPGPPQKGYWCVICPKCGGECGPKILIEKRRLTAKLAIKDRTITDLQSQLAASREEFRTTLAIRDREIAMLYENQNASREMGPCGKHPKSFTKPACNHAPDCPCSPYCTICYEFDREYKEIERLQETMKCGHPKSCWIEKCVFEHGRCIYCASLVREVEMTDGDCLVEHCTICAEKQAERAAVLEQAIYAVDKCEARADEFEGPYFVDKDSAIHNIQSLISPTDRLALDRYVEEKVREARLAEAEWWSPQVRDYATNIEERQARVLRLAELRAVPRRR